MVMDISFISNIKINSLAAMMPALGYIVFFQALLGSFALLPSFLSSLETLSPLFQPLQLSIPPITPKGTYTSYQIGPVCRPSGAIESPTTVNQVQNIVLSAIRTNKKVKAFGHRHSMTDIICTDGVAIDMSNFKGIKMNPDTSVTAAAGVTLRELGEFLHANNRALQVTPAYGDITVGGAIGTGAHGSSLKYESSLSGQTIGVKIIDGTGDIYDIKDPDELKAFRVHLGMVGIILEATMMTVPDFKMTVHNYEASDVVLTNGEWEVMTRAADSFFFYWFPSVGKVVISNGTFVPIDTPGNCWSNDHVPPTYRTFNKLATSAVELFQSIDFHAGMSLIERYLQETLTIKIPGFVPIYTDDDVTVQNPGTGYAYKMMDAICNTTCPWMHYPFNITFLDNELSLDVTDMTSFINTVKDILSKTPAEFVFQGILMRFSKASETYMSTANGRDTVHFEWYPVKRKDPYNTQSIGITAYQIMMQALVFTYGGRSHWGKSGMYYHSRDLIQKKLDPQSRTAFISKMQEYDPNQLFMNNFGERLLNNSNIIDLDPKTKHCALLDNCICSNNNGCAPGQLCGTIPGYTFNACKNTGLITLSINFNQILPFSSVLDYLRSVLGLIPSVN